MGEETPQSVSRQLPDTRPQQIKAALGLMDEGNMIPFIVRYRKEVTGTFDEVQLQVIRDEYHRVTTLRERQATVINKTKELDKLMPTPEKQINSATEL